MGRAPLENGGNAMILTIQFSPQVRSNPEILSVFKRGHKLVVNGKVYDLRLHPCDDWVHNVFYSRHKSYVEVLLPIPSYARYEARFPKPVEVTRNGRVDVPSQQRDMMCFLQDCPQQYREDSPVADVVSVLLYIPYRFCKKVASNFRLLNRFW